MEELKKVLCAEDFNIDDNLQFIRSKKEEVQYSTNYIMDDLDYDVEDIVERLKELSLQEYSETLIDNKDNNPPLLFVFGKVINNRQVYVKLKVKGKRTKRVLCLSFHYAKYIMKFPYAECG
ncbi:MAG: hypothetical protein PHD70_08635 [Anaerostipes sp.]|nr:hypothetical protein [Anaerostipes sp.]